MDISTRIRYSGNTTPYCVTNTKNKCSPFLCQFDSCQRICSLTTLTESYDDIVLCNYRITITEFTSIFYFRRDTAETLQKLFSDETRMPGSTTGYNDNTFCIHQLLLMV